MILPEPPEEALMVLYELRSECRDSLHAAESRGDLNEARRLQGRLREINSLIAEREGGPAT